MQTTIYSNSKHLYQELIQQVFGKNIMHIYSRIGKTNARYVLHILLYMGLLFLFSIRIHIPQDSIGNTEYSIGNITEQSTIKTQSNSSMMDPISDFGYELKGNSYSYPLPFFE